MSQSPQSALAAIIDQVWPNRQVSTEVLAGGMTNSNWVVRVDDDVFVVQVQMPDLQASKLGIDRGRQRRAQDHAADCGIAPRIVMRVPEYRALISEWVPGSPLAPAGSRDDCVLAQLARALKLFHVGPAGSDMHGPIADPFVGTRLLAESARRVSPASAACFDFAFGFLNAFESARQDRTATLTHGDLLADNILCTEEDGLRIIDYEYAAVGDPLYDLGDLAGKNDFTRSEIESLLRSYGVDSLAESVRVVSLYSAVSLLREGLWAVAASTNTVDFDYFQYAETCRGRLAQLLERPSTSADLDWLTRAAHPARA